MDITKDKLSSYGDVKKFFLFLLTVFDTLDFKYFTDIFFQLTLLIYISITSFDFYTQTFGFLFLYLYII